MLLLTWVTLFATSFNSYAEDTKASLSVPHSINLIVDFKYCRNSLNKFKDETIVLSEIIKEEKAKSKNLYDQNSACNENYTIKEKQTNEWKKEYTECTDELIKAKDWPWWKFDFKSISVGSILTLLALLL